MATMTLMPGGPAEWTVDDLERLPDDGLGYELCDGILLVSPAPVVVHQRAIGKLHLLLSSRCPDDMEVLFAPVDWQPDRRTSFQPDVLVARVQADDAKNITGPLLLAVEVLSPSTRRIDLMLKWSKYQDSGVTSYWVVDPNAPSVTVFELRDGSYVTVAEAKGDDTVTLELPFAVEVTPTALVHR